MIFLIFSSLRCSFSLVLPLCLSPILLGVWILCLRAWIGRLLALGVSSWIRILMVMIYVGGLNVLFAYFVAIAPNQYFFFFNLFCSVMVLFSSCLISFLLYPLYFTLMEGELVDILKLFFRVDRRILFFLAVVLFLALVMVVKIARRYEGALRPFNQ